MQRAVHCGKRNIVLTIGKDRSDALSLLGLIAQHIEGICLRQECFEGLTHPIKVLMENRLRLRLKRQGCVCSTHRTSTDVEATKVEHLAQKLRIHYQFLVHGSLVGKRLLVAYDRLLIPDTPNSFLAPGQVFGHNQGLWRERA